MWREDTRFDWAHMQRILADDFWEIGQSGRRHDRQAVLGVTTTPINAILPLPDLAIRLLDPDHAQVSYISETAIGGERRRALRSSIWSRGTDSGGNAWRLRLHQGTAIAVEL